MEHLTPPGRVAPIIVPYVCTEDYDNDEFISYPMRKGWDLSIWYTYQLGSPLDVARWLPDGKSLEDVAAFLQTWLYFGLIASIASVFGAEVEPRTFVRMDDYGNPWITTASLPQYVTDCERAREKHPESTWGNLFGAIRTNLDLTMEVCDVLGQMVDYGRKEYKTLRVIDFSLGLLIW